jgi:hypothetical protein
MASGTYRIHFDATLDELVDANLRLRTRSRSAQGYRTRSVWVAGGALCVALLAVVFIRARAAPVHVSVAIWGVLVVVALGLGAVFGYVFPWSNAAGVEDTGDAIELRFTPGIVVARNRAFRDGVDRARFLERARALAGRFATPR